MKPWTLLKHVLSAKLFEALCELERLEIKFVLGSFGDSLYVLVSRFTAWWGTNSLVSTNVGLKELTEFMSYELPKNDPCASILRHRQAVMEVAGSSASAVRTTRSLERPLSNPGGAQLVVSRNKAIVRKVHSLHALQLLFGITNASLVGGQSDDELFRNYIYLRRSNLSQKIEVVELDDAALQFLERFDEPTSYYDYCLSLEANPEEGYVDWDQVLKLISLGVLEWSACSL